MDIEPKLLVSVVFSRNVLVYHLPANPEKWC